MWKRVLGIAALLTTSLSAQCVMCARTAAAQNNERVKVLRDGVVVLLVPPVAIMGFFLTHAFRRRN
jgi:hypothetical protein